MRRVLIRVGYAMAPVAMLGTIALNAGPGRHRVAIFVFAGVVAVLMWITGGDERPASAPVEGVAPRSAPPGDQEPLGPPES